MAPAREEFLCQVGYLEAYEGLSRVQAIAKVRREHPVLAKQYDTAQAQGTPAQGPVRMRKEQEMTAWTQMETLATERVHKGVSRTREQAIAAVARERPDLVAQYRQEPRPHVAVAKEEPRGEDHWSLTQLRALAEDMRREGGYTLTMAQALDRACKLHPPLVAAYKEHRRELLRQR